MFHDRSSVPSVHTNGAPVVAKVLGADFELANSLISEGHNMDRAGRAADLLLQRIVGYPDRRRYGGTAIEFGRRFLPNGGSWYIDSDHLEGNVAEHTRAKDHALHLHAALRIARAAQLEAQADLPQGTRLEVIANNCDGHVSYGAHLNVMTTAKAFDDILRRKPHLGAFFATHLVTSVLYTGQGLVGAANGRGACGFQLSQRADWFEEWSSVQTMQRRPLLNTRDEPHASGGLARMHIIYLDMTLAPLSNFLRAGTTQLVLAMCEAGFVDATLSLDDPLDAASAISRDLSLAQTYATTTRGRRMSAVAVQQAIHDLAAEFVASGAAEQAVPDAGEILRQWQTTLDLLAARELDQLARRHDNWMKYFLIQRARGQRNLGWDSAELKILDLRFGSLDPDEGLFFRMAQAGMVELWPESSAIERFVHEPPEDTRAWLRGQVLLRHGAEVSHMDWSWIDFRVPSHRGWWNVARLSMPDPRAMTRAECEARLSQCSSLDDLVEAFTSESSGSSYPAPSRTSTSSWPSSSNTPASQRGPWN